MGWKTRLELATLGTTIRCSNQLSYIHRQKNVRQIKRFFRNPVNSDYLRERVPLSGVPAVFFASEK